MASSASRSSTKRPTSFNVQVAHLTATGGTNNTATITPAIQDAPAMNVAASNNNIDIVAHPNFNSLVNLRPDFRVRRSCVD